MEKRFGLTVDYREEELQKYDNSFDTLEEAKAYAAELVGTGRPLRWRKEEPGIYSAQSHDWFFAIYDSEVLD